MSIRRVHQQVNIMFKVNNEWKTLNSYQSLIKIKKTPKCSLLVYFLINLNISTHCSLEVITGIDHHVFLLQEKLSPIFYTILSFAVPQKMLYRLLSLK